MTDSDHRPLRSVLPLRMLRLFARLCLGLALGALPARAQPPEPASAEALFQAAKRDAKAGDWAAACPRFEASMALDASVATQIWIARCREREGKPADAFRAYERAAELNAATLDPARRKELSATISAALGALEPRRSWLTLVVQPTPGVEVRHAGALIAPDQLGKPRLVNPGLSVIETSAPGKLPDTRWVSLEEGQRWIETIALVDAPPQPPATMESPPPPAVPPVTPLAWGHGAAAGAGRQAAVVVGGVGLALLVVAGVVGARTLQKVSRSSDYCRDDNVCKPDGVRLRAEARELQTAGLWLAGSGLVGVAAGSALWLWSSPRGVSAGVTGAGLWLRGSW